MVTPLKRKPKSNGRPQASLFALGLDLLIEGLRLVLLNNDKAVFRQLVSFLTPKTHENWLVLIFCRVQRKNIFLPPFDPDSEWVMYYHRIKTLRQIDENGKKQYEFEIIKSRSVSIRKGLFSEMIKESIERYHRKNNSRKY